MKKKYIKVTLKEPITAMVEIDFDFSQPLVASMQVEQVKRNLSHEIRQKLMEQIDRCEGVHIQQAIYSTFHSALTQVCFGCQKVRSTIKRSV